MQSQSLEQRQDLRQEQILAPQQLQSLEILLATLPELEQRISEELVRNPTLELETDPPEPAAGETADSPDDAPAAPDDNGAAPLAAERTEDLDDLVRHQELWHDRLLETAPPPSQPAYSEDDEERRQFFFDSLVAEPSLQETLVRQLEQVEGLDDQRQRLCREIVGSIDDNGYLRTNLADIAIACNTTSLEEAEACLRIVQQFDPPGVGARDLRECLLLQLERDGREKSLEHRVVDRHLPEIARNHLREVARALRVSMADLREALERIRRLQPHPGAAVAPASPGEFVVPEVYIERDEDGQWTVRTDREHIPRLRFSSYYLNLLADATTPAEVRAYIRARIGDGKVLLRALDQREATIARIARSILDRQRGFFENGVDAMKPLTMSQVAGDLNVHETTVSRAIANKYVMTPHGLFPFRHFFSGGYQNEQGEGVSTLVIKERLRNLVSSEEADHPLSDLQLTEQLRQQGLNVARRTVAKYREELGIPSSSLRRRY